MLRDFASRLGTGKSVLFVNRTAEGHSSRFPVGFAAERPVASKVEGRIKDSTGTTL